MSANRPFIFGIAAVVLLAARSSFGAEIELPAAAASITAPFVLTNGYIVQAIATDTTNGGRATFEFAVAAPGKYLMAAVVEAPAEGANSLSINVDDEPQGPGMVWDIPSTKGFATNYVCWSAGNRTQTRVFRLLAGKHQVIVRGRGANTKLAQLSLLKAPPPPPNVRIVGQP